jgi:hypothetical protein
MNLQAVFSTYGKRVMGTTMADRTGLKIVGFFFATVTLAVTLATCMVVKGYADGVYSLENAPAAEIASR